MHCRGLDDLIKSSAIEMSVTERSAVNIKIGEGYGLSASQK
jgi:hypothetical protein